MHGSKSADKPRPGFEDVRKDELKEIVERRRVAFGERRPDDHHANSDDVAKSLVGLALSGGGLRSATFNLGFLQALRKRGLLRYVDYLSSVSGGGYTAGYLAAVAQRDKSREWCYHDDLPGKSDAPADEVALAHRFGWFSMWDRVRFAACGKYLTKPAEFAAEYLATTALMLALFAGGLLTLALIAALVWRVFDFDIVRDRLTVIDWNVELFIAFIPGLILVGLWLTLSIGQWILAWLKPTNGPVLRGMVAIVLAIIAMLTAYVWFAGVFWAIPICTVLSLPVLAAVLIVFGHRLRETCRWAGGHLASLVRIGEDRQDRKTDIRCLLDWGIPYCLPVAVVFPVLLAAFITCPIILGEPVGGPIGKTDDWARDFLTITVCYLVVAFIATWWVVGTERLAEMLFKMALFSPLIGLIILMANGSLGLSWFADFAGVSAELTNQQMFREPLMLFVAACLLALFRYRSLLNSQKPKAGFWERVLFQVIVSGIIVGVPLLMVGWAARENISKYAHYRDPDILVSDIRNWSAFVELMHDKRAVPQSEDGPKDQEHPDSEPGNGASRDATYLFDGNVVLYPAAKDGEPLLKDSSFPDAVELRKRIDRIAKNSDEDWGKNAGGSKDGGSDAGAGSGDGDKPSDGVHAGDESGVNPFLTRDERSDLVHACALIGKKDAAEGAPPLAEEGTPGKDSGTEKKGATVEEALAAVLALQRYTDANARGSLSWERNSRMFLDPVQGWLSRVGMLLHSYAPNRATAEVEASHLARDVQRDAVKTTRKRLRDSGLTEFLGEEVHLRVRKDPPGKKNELVESREYIAELAASMEEGSRLLAYWDRATDHIPPVASDAEESGQPAVVSGGGEKTSGDESDSREGVPSKENEATEETKDEAAEGTPWSLVSLVRSFSTAKSKTEDTKGSEKTATELKLEVRRFENDPFWTPHEIASFNRLLLEALYPNIFKPRTMVSTPVVVTQDQWSRLEWLGLCGIVTIALFLILPINHISPIHAFYRRKLNHRFLEPVNDLDAKREVPSIKMSELNGHEHGAPYQLFLATLHAGQETPVEAGSKKKEPRRHHSLLFSKLYSGTRASGYLKTDEYMGKRFSLAEAVAISGAAISPMAVANGPLRWILSAFNLRTGQWIYHPRTASTKGWFSALRRRVREWGYVTPLQVFREWFGQSLVPAANSGDNAHSEPTDDWLLASAADGGYHEFLGLDELLQRRCRLIIVADAGSNSEENEFAVLGDAIRMARIDHGIEILDLDDDRPLDTDRLKRDEDRQSPQHYIFGRIRYPNDPSRADGSGRDDPDRSDPEHHQRMDGILVYVQMSLTGDESVDLKQYHAAHPSFPDEPIANQFFDEKMIESFRELGHHTGRRLCQELPQQEDSAEGFLTTVELIQLLVDGYAQECLRETEIDKLDFQSRLPYYPEAELYRRKEATPSYDGCAPKEVAFEAERQGLILYERDAAFRRRMWQAIETHVGEIERN